MACEVAWGEGLLMHALTNSGSTSHLIEGRSILIMRCTICMYVPTSTFAASYPLLFWRVLGRILLDTIAHLCSSATAAPSSRRTASLRCNVGRKPYVRNGRASCSSPKADSEFKVSHAVTPAPAARCQASSFSRRMPRWLSSVYCMGKLHDVRRMFVGGPAGMQSKTQISLRCSATPIQ